MKYRALVGFSGLLTMRKNEVRELTDETIIKDLLQAKYIELAQGSNEPKPTTKKKTNKK